VKALSLRQPWAHAVVHLGKTIENRYWNTHLRGAFLIHAAKGMTVDEYLDAVLFCDEVLGRTTPARSIVATGEMPQPKALLRGGFVGRARLVGVLPPCTPKGAEPTLFAQECAHPWHMPEQYGFRLEGIEPLPFVPYAGSLGFFDVPEAVLRQVLP